MKDHFTYELEHTTAAYVAEEARLAGVSESEVVGFALAVFSHYRVESIDGSALLLSTPRVDQEGMALSALTVDQRRLPHVLALLDLRVGADFAMGRNASGPSLRLIRPTDGEPEQ